MPQPFSSTLPNNSTSIFISTTSPSCTLLFVLTLCILSLYTLHLHHPPPHPTTTQQHSLRFRDTFLLSASNYTISSYLRALTLHPHLAGTPPSLLTAQYVHSHFQSLGLPTHFNDHSVLLSYPLHSSLSAHFSNGTSSTLPLTEPGPDRTDVVRPYHAYSPSGSAYGEAVYVHHGTEEDYRALAALGVGVKGCVAIAKRGSGLSRNAVAEKAAEKGVAAVLMYTEAEGGGFRDGVERGTVMNGVGDPLTPGWAGGERLGLEDGEVLKRFPRVPSMPISAETAGSILGTLEGARLPSEWRDGALKGKVSRVGPGPTLLNFTYQVGWLVDW